MDKTPLHQHQHLHHQQQQQQQQQQVGLSQTTAHQHILSAAEGGLVAAAGLTGHGGRFGSSGKNAGGNSDPTGSNSIDRECRVSLEERELWSKFQELTNEMIVTKNGR